MDTIRSSPRRSESLPDLGPALQFFLMTFAISWAAAGALLLRMSLQGKTVEPILGLMIFPAMLLGPAVSGLFMTWRLGGSEALHSLWSRMMCIDFKPYWYAVLLLPPALILATLAAFTSFGTSGFRPNHFYPGAAFGVVAGFLEELGWTGFAYPLLRQRQSAVRGAFTLGIVWAIWHIPAINYLGAKTPHGSVWLRYFLAFALVMVALRILIAWLFTNTGSLLLAQLMHASSTASLVVLSPVTITAGREVLWYVVYGLTLWGVVLFIMVRTGRNLNRSQGSQTEVRLFRNAAPINRFSARVPQMGSSGRVFRATKRVGRSLLQGCSEIMALALRERHLRL